MTAVAEQTGAWLEQFTNQLPRQPWMQPLARRGLPRFAELGFPTTHDEEWRFTNVAPIARTDLRTGGARRVAGSMVFAGIVSAELKPARDDRASHLGKHAAFEQNAVRRAEHRVPRTT